MGEVSPGSRLDATADAEKEQRSLSQTDSERSSSEAGGT